ncbi:hypothetical protein BVG16_25480 [Paenibacillus selenitireducens]|uniref:Glycosyl transferase family 1 n=1 Tax=Paenibacillus selenitireducens TaxID=1324314 RepID=A0A1T2X2K5_9BACL|nr:glycosyltransferase [Paenibacillus selenitireducens]OPA74104.1 hypothetical protein BVG16_25480 [Paenibacillus selenitireducens]
MKILHVSLGLPPYRTGGLTKYCMDLMLTQIEQMNEVVLLYPGHHQPGSRSYIRKDRVEQGIQVYEIVNPLPVSLMGGIRKPKKFMKTSHMDHYVTFLQEINPDRVHLHTFMGIHRSFLEAAKSMQIPIVFTTHDYFGICPKVSLLDSEGGFCNDYGDGAKCIDCNRQSYRSMTLFLMQTKYYRKWKNSNLIKALRARMKKTITDKEMKKKVVPKTTIVPVNPKLAREYGMLRSYYIDMMRCVDYFHFNSTVSKMIYSQYLDVKGEVISISHRDIVDQRKIREFHTKDMPLRLTYLGPVDTYKGFFLLKECLDHISQTTNHLWHLKVYGGGYVEQTKEDQSRYSYKGRYGYEQLEEIFNETDLLIIPSLWKETFGFIGLEALAHGVPSLVSDYVGFTDLIQDGQNGMLFQPNSHDLIDKLLIVMEDREYLSQLNRNICTMDIHFTMDQHAKVMTDFYCSMKNSKLYKDHLTLGVMH